MKLYKRFKSYKCDDLKVELSLNDLKIKERPVQFH